VRLRWGFDLLASGLVLAGVLAFLGVASLLLVLLDGRPPSQEAAGQEQTVPGATAAPTPTSSPAPAASPQLTEGSVSRPEGIPTLSVMDIIGNLKHFRPEKVRFICDGPSPTTEGEGSMWYCSAPSRGKMPGTYEVTILRKDALTVLWVEATVRGVSEEQAGAYFSYVASLCLQETDPLNPEAWVEQHISSGGQVTIQGTELTIYGTKEERTLQVVATGFTVD
jgi:hypothetical protein